jgi:exportin-7
LSLSAITKLLSAEWKNLSKEQKQLMYSSLINLILNSRDMPGFLIGGISKLLARLCRFGWNELEEIKQISSTLESVLPSSPFLLFPVIKFYEELINEISEPIKGRSLTLNRKIAVSFRDEGLGKIFNFTLFSLNNQLQTLPVNLLAGLLTVLHQCLNFDFLGVSSDETCEDTICLQIPLQWKSHFENPNIFSLLRFIILESQGEVEVLALRVFNHIGAIRKTIFSGSLELKSNYIGEYLNVTKVFMDSNKFEGDSLFEFIQAVKRFLYNFGIKDVTESPAFDEWIKSLANYSVGLFTRQDAVISGIDSSMIIWKYLANESHLQLSSSKPVSQYVLPLFQKFLEYTLASVSLGSFDGDKENDLKEQIELISNFVIYEYVETGKILENHFSSLLELELFGEQEQCKLTWLILIASGMISMRDNKNTDGHLNLDAILIQLVFKTISKVPNSLECLQVSFVMFFQGLGKAYINSSYEKLWSMFYQSMGTEETVDRVLTPIFETCFNHLSVSSSGRLLRYSLDLLEVLSKGYYSNKYLVKNELIQKLMVQYKTYSICMQSNKLRMRLLLCLTHLWMNEDISVPVENFLAPLSDAIQAVSENLNSRDFELLFKELEGICVALQSQKNYLDFFEWFYFRFSIVMTACQHFLYDLNVMEALLDFLTELVCSRNSRIKFDTSTSYGLVLFKNVSSVVIGYGKIILECRGNSEMFKKFEKKIRKIVFIMNHLMNGGYVCFGVFEVYNDSCFFEALQMTFNFIDLVSTTEIMVIFRKTYVKLLDGLYEFIELVCKSHLKTLFTRLSKDCYSHLFYIMIQGVRSSSN